METKEIIKKTITVEYPKDSILVEALVDELESKGKHGIKLPYRRGETDKFLGFLKQLLEKGAISQSTYHDHYLELESRTLDDGLYKRFWTCMLISEQENIGE